MTDHSDFYTEEAKSYEQRRYGSSYGALFRQLQRRAVVRALRDMPDAHVLDVATGTGQMLPVLNERNRSVTACDLTPAMLHVARRLTADLDRIDFVQADAARLPYPDHSFDVVASSRFLHLFDADMQKSLLREMARVLRPGGLMVVDFYNSTARRIYFPLIWLYRTVRRKRPENDHRLSIGEAKRMAAALGIDVCGVQGIGNFVLLPLLWKRHSSLLAYGEWLGRHLPFLSEQFVLVGVKK